MGQTPQATVDTIYEVNKLARKATVCARIPLTKSTLTVLLWWSRTPMLGGPHDQTALRKGRQPVFIANAELLQGKEPNVCLITKHSSRLRRVGRSSFAAETQAAADGDDEAVYIRLCLKEIPFGQLDLPALVVDCRRVCDALARFFSSCLGLKDKKSGLDALGAQTESH